MSDGSAYPHKIKKRDMPSWARLGKPHFPTLCWELGAKREASPKEEEEEERRGGERKEEKEKRGREGKRERERKQASKNSGWMQGSHKTLSYKTAGLLSRRPTKSQKKMLLSQNEHENSSQTLSSSHTEEINRISDPEVGEREREEKKKRHST